jgi:hypothetical protein
MEHETADYILRSGMSHQLVDLAAFIPACFRLAGFTCAALPARFGWPWPVLGSLSAHCFPERRGSYLAAKYPQVSSFQRFNFLLIQRQ